jgi:hypothetical protein
VHFQVFANPEDAATLQDAIAQVFIASLYNPTAVSRAMLLQALQQ